MTNCGPCSPPNRIVCKDKRHNMPVVVPSSLQLKYCICMVPGISNSKLNIAGPSNGCLGSS